MKSQIFTKNNILFLIYTVLSTAILMAGDIMSQSNRFIAGLVIILTAFIFYFYIVLFVAHKNWLDIRATFHAVWIVTIGLACLRLTDYQEQWQSKTWLCLALAYLMFQIGAHIGILSGKKIYDSFPQKRQYHIGKIHFHMHENRLWWICIVTTLIGLACFLANVVVKGFIPCFSDDVNAYLEFYTRFHVFAVAATGVSGLCYYCIVKQKLSIFKKIILGLCILYSTFIFPTLVVSRGTFIVSALSLTVTAFYIHKKRFLALALCLVSIVGIYYSISQLRNYTDEQLQFFFEASEIPLQPEKPDSEDEDSDSTTNPPVQSFQLPPKLAFIYTYLTVSHDNFNEAVQNSTEYTYGLRQLAPFNTILRIPWIDEQMDNAEYYLVRPHLNTTNLIGNFYYDFHLLGVVIFMLVWALIFGLIQRLAELSQTPFFLLALGNVMPPVILCFFATWLSVFSQWMLWGVVLLFAIAATITRKQKTTNKD